MDSSAAASSARLLLNPNPSTFHLPRRRPRQPRSPYLLRCSAAPPFLSCSTSPASAARLHRLASEFRSLPEPVDRVKLLLSYASGLHPFPDADRVPSNRVPGCTAEVWLSARIDAVGRMRFAADSDSEITRGFCACLLTVVDGEPPEEVLAMRADDLADLNVVGSTSRAARSRVNTWQNVLVSMQHRTRALVAEETGRRQPVDPFPARISSMGGEESRSARF
ncbi:SufE-like protein, chloroplastic [Apostasia shenzhenica]|uniref:SufE-like protein, chloroplastic n=1 Tax=Apostasia shenzhenica TaxID=1088818 RepID=A0A2I0AQI4_9ASPA|nr:SufE-like protein, chloroplastic [Apostasia shenzhenica]